MTIHSYEVEENDATSHSIRGKTSDYLMRASQHLPDQISKRIETTPPQPNPAGRSLLQLISDITVGCENAVIALDWTFASRLSDEVPAYASDQDYTSVVVPHGDSPFWNTVRRPKSFDCLLENADFDSPDDLFEVTFSTWADKAKYDYILMPNELTARRVTPFADPEQIEVLGSPRYSLEWLDILSDIDSGPVPQHSAALNVVFFTRQSHYYISEPAVRDTVELVTKFPNTHLVVKEHPRGHIFGQETELNDLTNCDIVRDGVESAALTRWGDIFLSLGTTITFEPIMRKKPVLAVEYAHGNYTTVARYFSNADIRSRDDLYDTMHAINESDGEFYGADEYRQFVEEMVTASNDSVLDSYAKFFESRLATES